MDNYEYCAGYVAQAAQGSSPVVLDYGCGAGQIVEALHQRHIDAFGCDVFYQGGDEAAAVAENAWGKYVVRMEAGIIPFPSCMFDFVVNNQVMEHVENLDHVLLEIKRVLKPGGQVLSLFPDWGVWPEVHCGIPFLHWFPKGSRPRIYYAALLRAFGLGYHKGKKSVLTWSKDFCNWLDRWTFYRPYAEIQRLFAKHFEHIRHLEEDWLRKRLGPRTCRFVPARIRRAVARKLGGLVFACSKGV